MQGCKKSFTIQESQAIFEKIRIEITDFPFPVPLSGFNKT